MCVEAQKLHCTIPEHLQMMRVLSAFDRWLVSPSPFVSPPHAKVGLSAALLSADAWLPAELCGDNCQGT